MKRFLSVAVICAVATLGVAFGAGAASGSSGGPIAIGGLTSLTSTFAPWGVQARDGMQFAVNQINASGGVKAKGAGRKLKLDVVDDTSAASGGIAGWKELTQQDHVISVGGLIDSDVAVATAPLAEKAKIPQFLIKAGTSSILTLKSRYTFRTCLPAAAEVAQPILQYAKANNITSIGAIVADYAWGFSIKSSIEATFAADPQIHVNIQDAPITATTFTSYLQALQNDHVQMIVATGDPPGSGTILAQSLQLGMKVPVVGAYTPFSLVEGLAGAAAYNAWTDFKCQAVNSSSYQSLAAQFLKAFPSDKVMEDDAVAGYAYVKIMAQAIAAVGTNPTAIDRYVHAHTFNEPGYTFPLKWTAWGEIADARIALDQITSGPAPSGDNTSGAWWIQQLSLSSPLKPYKP